MNRFLEEIHEQPEALRETLSLYMDEEVMEVMDELVSTLNAGGIDNIIFTGMGSSYFVSYAAAILLSSMGKKAVATNAGELLHYGHPVIDKRTLLVCISQSGESFEIKKLLKKKEPHTSCIGITNNEKSTLGHNANMVLPVEAGIEEMTSTKTYITTLLVSYIFGWKITGAWNEDLTKRLKKLPGQFKHSLHRLPETVENALDFMGDLNALPVIARGPAYCTASQSALMFNEADKVPAFSILGGEFRHGPMEMVQPGVKAILFAPAGKTFDQSMKMAKDIARFGGKVLLITDSGTKLTDENIFVIKVPGGNEFLFSITGILPLQLMVDAYAKRKGFEAGSFSQGAKITKTE